MLVLDLSPKLNIYLCLSDNNNIRVNEGTYKIFTAPMKEVSRINFNFSSEYFEGGGGVETKNYVRDNIDGHHAAYMLNLKRLLQKYDLHKFKSGRK